MQSQSHTSRYLVFIICAIHFDGQSSFSCNFAFDEEAKQQYDAALRLNPALDVANLGLGLLLARRGDFGGSKLHCEAAMKSTDAELREQAQTCLSR